MNKLTFAFLIAAFLLLIAPAQATIYVGDCDEAGLTTISEAIEKANENETIIVCEGIYRENVVIDKPLILKASGNVTIEAIDADDFVVWLKANNVVFSGFNVTRGLFGITLDNVRGCRIENNRVFANGDTGIGLEDSSWNEVINNVANKNLAGIVLIGSNNNTIKDNTASENEYTGIYLENSSRNEVSNNIFNNKNLYGIVLFRSNNTIIKDNTASENRGWGIYLEDSPRNEVSNNIINKNWDGIVLFRSNNTIIKDNTASENGNWGIYLEDSSRNEVSNNIINKNGCGIVLIGSNNTIIKDNTAYENRGWGIYLQYSSRNAVSNNIINKNGDAIVLFRSNNTIIKDNTASENKCTGLYLQYSSRNEVSNNIINKNLYGIVLFRSNNTIIKDNTASENGMKGIDLQYSSRNEVSNNIFNKNLYGIVLFRSNNTIIKDNTASENGKKGIDLEDSARNEVSNNIFNKNFNNIILIGSNNNNISNNNIVNNKIYIQNSYYNKFDYNYWGDYRGEDKNGDGIGDEPYKIDEENEDPLPYMNYSGWLNVVVTPEFWYFFAKKGDVINNTFSIENRLNRAIKVEVLLDENLGFEEDSDLNPKGAGTSKKTISVAPKSTQIVTLRLNTTNLEGYILRKIIFKTEEYTKTTLVNGFVQPKIHKVKVEGVDFQRNVVQGQINPFKIFLRNYGDKDEFEVKLRMGNEKVSREVYLTENETKTLLFEIDTSNLPLGINNGEVIVSKDERLDYLNLTMFVASKLEASTLVVTNLTRFKFNESEKLRSELISLTHHPAVNGILLDVTCNYTEFDSNYSKANELCEEIKEQIEDRISNYPNMKYLIIVGDDHVIPFYRIKDGTTEVFTVITGLPDEGDYSLTTLPSNSVKKALSENNFLTDDFYAHLAAGRVLAVGRLVEKPDEIIKAIDMFFNYYQLTPTNVFVTGYDFMYDGSAECCEEWRKRIDTTFKYKDKKSSNYVDPDEIISEIFNSSISAIFLHANYDEFEVPSGISVKREYLGVEEIRALNGSIIYTMGCHAGLTIPEVKDLPQAVLSNGTIAYIAPTGYGLGGIITVAGHERLIEYLTKRIACGEEVGFALFNAKNDYYLDNFNQDKLDEKVIKSLTLYGFPMYAVRLDSSITAMGGDAELEEHSIKDLAYTVSNITLEEATLILKPTFKVYETENGTYYSYQDISTEAGMPILPKATWYFIRGDKEIRGIALRSASFEVNETRLAIENFAVSDGTGSENELRGWYPTIPFTLNTIEDRQGIVTASAQYKYTEWPKKGTIRLFNEIVLDIFRVPVDAEKEKPVVNVSVDKDVTVKAEDNAGIYDVLITYLDSENNSWESKCLGHSESERKSVEYSILLNNTVFFVQAIDVNGNVKIDDNKGRYYVC